MANQESGSIQKWLIPSSIAAYSLATLSWWAQPELFHALLRGLAFNESAAGYIVAIEICAIAVTSFILAPRIGVLPLRTVCVAGALVAVAGHGISIYLDNFATLLLVRGLTGVGEGCALAIANALIATTAYPEREYGKMNMIGVAIGGLFLAAIPVLEIRYAHVGVFAGLVIVNLALLPLLLLLPSREAPEISSVQLVSHRRAAATLLWFSTLLWATAIAAVWPFMVVLGLRADLNPQTVGIVIGVISLASVFSSGLASWLNTRFGRLRPLLIGMAVQATAVFSLVHSTTAVVFMVATAFMAGGIYFNFTYLLGLGAALDQRGGCSAGVAGMFVLAGGIGPAVGGMVIEWTGGYGAMGWIVIVSVVVAFAIISYIDGLASKPLNTVATV